jgi:hypothetical protein
VASPISERRQGNAPAVAHLCPTAQHFFPKGNGVMSKRTRLPGIPLFATFPLLLAPFSLAISAEPPPTAPAYLERTDGTAKRPRPNLTGTIRDDKGAPVAGATILLYTAAPRVGTSPFCPSCYPDCQKKETTDGKGAFKIASLDPALIFTVLVIADGRPPQFVRKVDPAKGPLQVKLPPAPPPADLQKTVRGIVLDTDGQPVSGATVEVNSLKNDKMALYGTPPGVDPVTVTDRKGIFQFVLTEARSELGVRINARGYAPCIAADLATGSAVPHSIRLTRGAAVSGRLSDAQGKGIGGATVQLVPVDRNAGTFTGWHDIGTSADGEFMLVNVPANTEYVLLAKMDALAPSGAVALQQRIKTGAEGTSVTGASLKTQPGATLSGKVVLSDGKPIPNGIRLMVGREATWDAQFALLNKDGSFSLTGLPYGEKLDLTLRVPGYKPSAKNGKVEPWGSMHLTIPNREASPRNLIIWMEPETAK